LDWDKAGSYGPRVGEFCGNNVSRGGQGNFKHCFYLKRGLPGEESTYKLVDNVIHSCNGSEGFKTTGEKVLVSGNRFYKTVPPDEHQPSVPVEEEPGREPKYTSTMLSVVACSETEVRNNLFHAYRPDNRGYSAGLIVQVTGRRGIQGCDRPRGYIGDNTDARPDYTSEFWNKDHWDSIAGEYPFSHVYKGNTFDLRGEPWDTELDAPRGTAIRMYGTYPNIAVKGFGASCLLEAPTFWRERSRVFVHSDNAFVGFEHNLKNVHLEETYKGHMGYDPATGTDAADGDCLLKGYPYPSTADLRELGTIVEID
jgi:hypothetical protein